MMAGHQVSADLSTAIAEAAFDTSKWVAVCDRFSQLVNAKGAIIVPAAPSLSRVPMPHSASIDDAFQRYIKDEWYMRDTRYEGAAAMRRNGYIVDADSIAYDAVGRSAYYQEFLRPAKLQWFLGIPFGTAQEEWVMSIQAEIGRDTFNEDEIQTVLAHKQALSNAVAISRQLDFQRFHAIADVMEQHGRAALALDQAGRVAHVSTEAEQLIGKTILISGGKLRAANPRDDAPLQAMVHSLYRGNGTATQPAKLTSVGGGAPVIAYGCRLPEREYLLLRPATILLLFKKTGEALRVSPDYLKTCLGVSAAEARLAAALFSGMSIEDYAAAHGVTLTTVRNQMQSLLNKTGTHGKAELISLLHRLTP